MKDYRYGYNDKNLVQRSWNRKKTYSLILAVLFLVALWFFLAQKLIFGGNWISPTYDNQDWKTNEGDLHTNGAWDLETHIWKSEYVLKYFPNFNWNPYWYLGMPLLKYYQSGFYIVNLLISFLTGLSIPKSALIFVILGHLASIILTFILAYKVSGKIWVAALASVFLIASSFITIRSYGWEPISAAFLFLYPLGLLIFLRQPLKPFRFWLILVLGIAYLAHPLLWFSLGMTMGIFLLTIAIRKKESNLNERHSHYILGFFGLVFFSMLIGAVQFIPQLSYHQVTSGAHMGVTYLPFYHVQYNVISLFSFFLDAGNLKGPGFVVMVAFVLVVSFGVINARKKIDKNKSLLGHEIVAGFMFVLIFMVLFYYAEKYNIFPMNILRSIQYHRIIPEFIVAAGVLIAAMSNIVRTHGQKTIYYGFLIAFSVASFIVIYDVQTQWQTTNSISDKPEFIYDNFTGRITFPYTEQSLSARNSFTEVPQVYGYYEQGITNPYADELFSVSSGYHALNVTVLYLTAADVERVYINKQEGDKNKIMYDLLKDYFNFTDVNERYGYFDLNLSYPEFAQAVSLNEAEKVNLYKPGCRVMFKEEYCGSVKEEFVTTDYEEQRYLQGYVNLLHEYPAIASINMTDPQHYDINVSNATPDTAIIVKMTYDKDFTAETNGKKLKIETIGPDFMLISPQLSGNYVVKLQYHLSKYVLAGAIVSIFSFLLLIFIFVFRFSSNKFLKFNQGELENVK